MCLQKPTLWFPHFMVAPPDLQTSGAQGLGLSVHTWSLDDPVVSWLQTLNIHISPSWCAHCFLYNFSWGNWRPLKSSIARAELLILNGHNHLMILESSLCPSTHFLSPALVQFHYHSPGPGQWPLPWPPSSWARVREGGAGVVSGLSPAVLSAVTRGRL